MNVRDRGSDCMRAALRHSIAQREMTVYMRYYLAYFAVQL